MGNENSNKPNDPVMDRLDKIEKGLKVDLEKSQTEVKELTEKIDKLAKSNNQPVDDVVDLARRSANIMSLHVIDGAPIVKSEMSAVLGIEGVEMIAYVVNAKGDKYSIPVGCDIKRVDFTKDSTKELHKTSYENLKVEKFNLMDIDENDLTGASKIEKGKVVSEGTPIPEIDRSTGVPVATGRKIRTRVIKDVRHYTIEFNNKKFTMTDDYLGNIRF